MMMMICQTMFGSAALSPSQRALVAPGPFSSPFAAGGKVVSINYQVSGGFQGMSVGLRIKGVEMSQQQVLLDSGSPSIAFCDTGLLTSPGFDITSNMNSYAGLYQCNEYGDGDPNQHTATCSWLSSMRAACTRVAWP